jgi:hypothetical protein
MIAAYFCDTLHVKEEPKGSNRGPWIDAFLLHAKTDVGQAWCAGFVWYCVTHAGIKPSVKLPAAVKSWRAWAKANGAWSKVPRRGRLFTLASSHIGFVTGVDGDMVLTIEGNSNDEGSREGHETCRRRRPISSIEGYIDLSGVKP